MFEGSRMLNRLMGRPYYLYWYWDDHRYVGKRSMMGKPLPQVVTQKGKDTPHYGDRDYPRPHQRDQVWVMDSMEAWVDVDVKQFEPLHSTKPAWVRVKDKKPEERTKEEIKQLEFIEKFQHFDPAIIAAYTKSQTVPKLLAGKKDKWEALIPVIIIGIIAALILIISSPMWMR